MKKIFLFIATVLLLSGCSTESPFSYSIQVLPVVDIEMPESFTVGNQHPIHLTYRLPTECHLFNGFYYDKVNYYRLVGIQALVAHRDVCLPYDEDEPLREATLTFLPIEAGTYIFRFFKGKDEEGQNIFEEIEIEVNAN